MSQSSLDDLKKEKETECFTSNIISSIKSRRKYEWMIIEDEQEVKNADLYTKATYVAYKIEIFKYTKLILSQL